MDTAINGNGSGNMHPVRATSNNPSLDLADGLPDLKPGRDLSITFSSDNTTEVPTPPQNESKPSAVAGGTSDPIYPIMSVDLGFRNGELQGVTTAEEFMRDIFSPSESEGALEVQGSNDVGNADDSDSDDENDKPRRLQSSDFPPLQINNF